MNSNKENSFLSLSSDEEESEKDESQLNKNNNKNVINKHNIQKNEINLINNKEEKEKEKENSAKEYILKLQNKLNNNIVKTKNKKMLILPPPENELTDKHYKDNVFQDEDLENKGFIKLMNPDNMNLNIKDNDDINNDGINDEKNIISINQKDILDKNWEIKYINKILKKDMKEAIKNEENIEDKNKINKKRKRDKNKNEDDDELNDDNIRSKYDKISTKKKYGW